MAILARRPCWDEGHVEGQAILARRPCWDEMIHGFSAQVKFLLAKKIFSLIWSEIYITLGV
jgi:hypothetical protein